MGVHLLSPSLPLQGSFPPRNNFAATPLLHSICHLKSHICCTWETHEYRHNSKKGNVILWHVVWEEESGKHEPKWKRFSFHVVCSFLQLAYSTLWYSIMKTFAMTLGELNYEDTFIPSSKLHYAPAMNVLFLLFCLIMPIILMNMLVRKVRVILSTSSFEYGVHHVKYISFRHPGHFQNPRLTS